MEKLIIIKYGELSTKKENINLFLNILKKNIRYTLGDEPKIYYDRGRMFIETIDFDTTLNKLKKVFGIHAFLIAYKMDTNTELIKDNVLELVKEENFKTFKVTTKRSDKSFPISSMDFSRDIGGVILKNIPAIRVDVHNPELNVNIEIRHDYTYIYFNEEIGIGGYPVGTNGKGMLMLSGGIDSPVAGYMGIKRGLKIECVYFAAPPHTSEDATNKVLSLAKILAPYNNGIKVHIINFTQIEEAIYKDIPNYYLITIMRRMMYRITARLCYHENCKAIINGESIGQVASQTLTSMGVINSVTDMPVIRPLACLDKLEIITMAKKIGTYDTSILPYEDCCTIFVPDHPVINPIKDQAIEYEKLIPYEDMINEAIKNEKIIKLDTNHKEFSDIL
jgi:thiamine biosynthesis protein ThiI